MQSIFEKKEYKRLLRYDIFGIVPRLVCDIQCCWQRCRKGYCYRDIWDIDLWFLEIMPDMLKDFRKMSQGIPNRIYEKYSKEENGEEKAEREWKAIIKRMEHLFREANEETCRKKNPYMNAKGRIKKAKYYEEEQKLAAYRYRCKDEAIQLFSEWFYDLWN